MKKGVKKRKKQIADASEAVTTEVDVDDAETDEDSLEETDADESVTVDLGDVDVDEDDPEHIADAEKEILAEAGDQHSAARTLAIRRALEERNERRRMAEDLDYLDFDDDQAAASRSRVGRRWPQSRAGRCHLGMNLIYRACA